MSGGELVAAARMGSQLFGAGPSRATAKREERVRVAKGVHAFRIFERDASDVEVCARLGDELPEWLHSNVVIPRISNDLYRCFEELDEGVPGDVSSVRAELRRHLAYLYRTLMAADPIVRGLRELSPRVRMPRKGGRSRGNTR